jgi:hypothetical protein
VIQSLNSSFSGLRFNSSHGVGQNLETTTSFFYIPTERKASIGKPFWFLRASPEPKPDVFRGEAIKEFYYIFSFPIC